MPQSIPYLKPVVIVDVETTGGSASTNRLIEIGIIRLENGVEVRRFESLVQPGQSVPIFVQNLTGISDHDLKGAPVFSTIADEVEACLKDALFIGHNVRFDYDFVRHEFRRLNRRFVAPTLCSARLSRAFFPEYKRHSLSELVARYDLPASRSHRALDDAQAVWDYFSKCQELVGSQKFRDVFEKLVAGRPPQTRIPAARFQNVPETAGVYVFRDVNAQALYVGKSSNLRERILGHFYGDFENPKEQEWLGEATDLEWMPAPGELSALFLEAELVQKLNPVNARKTRKAMGMVCAVKRKTQNGYDEIYLELESKVEDKSAILSYYRGFREAKQALELLANKFNLCRKLADLEKGPGPCQARKISKCSGACEGVEAFKTYNLRVQRAFQQGGVESWPYASAVWVDELDEDSKEGQSFLIHNWLMLARVFHTKEGKRSEKLSDGFDWDRLKILKRSMQEDGRVRPVTPDEMRRFLQEPSSKSK